VAVERDVDVECACVRECARIWFVWPAYSSSSNEYPVACSRATEKLHTQATRFSGSRCGSGSIALFSVAGPSRSRVADAVDRMSARTGRSMEAGEGRAAGMIVAFDVRAGNGVERRGKAEQPCAFEEEI
jgi:hypothetical protein